MFDVIIVGGGVVGTSTADVLNQRGLKTAIIEQYEPATEHGSSHGDGRMIRYDYGEAVYVEMVRRSFDGWAEIVRRTGAPLLCLTGTCNFGPSESIHLAELEANLSAADISCERLTAQQSNSRFPQFHLDSGSETVYQADGGVLFAETAVRKLWQLAITGGTKCIVGERVVDICETSDGLEISSDSGRQWSGRHLVLATGGWSGRWFEALGLSIPLTVTREQLAYFKPSGPVNHLAGNMPNCIDYHTEQPFYTLPQIKVPGVKAGWHHMGKEVDADSSESVDERNLAAVSSFIANRCPHLDPKPFQVSHCLYTNSSDYHFVIDRHPTMANITVATGFSGHGFKFGPVLGDMIADMVLGASSSIPVELFSLSRFDNPGQLTPRKLA